MEVVNKPYIIAEAGVHHLNSMALAIRYIEAAKLAGADAVKFQTYSASKLATKWAPSYFGDKKQFEFFLGRSRFLPHDYRRLFAVANDVGIDLLSTPFDIDAAQMLHAMGMRMFKVASGDLTNWPLLRGIASLGRPMLLSTGGSTFAEIRQTNTMLGQEFGVHPVLMHCSLAYPTPTAEANLGRIVELKRGHPDSVIGYSDHTLSALACPMAVTLGAVVIEKHFTLSPLQDDDDHFHSVDAAGLSQLVRDCKDAYAMASYNGEVMSCEKDGRRFARRSIVASRNLPAGHVLTAEDMDYKRPGTGVSPVEAAHLVGRVTLHALNEDELIEWEDLEEVEDAN